MGKMKKKLDNAIYQRFNGVEREEVVKVERGFVPMLVGKEKMERFLVQTELLNHPYIKSLFDMAAQEFGYKQEGILRIPCEIEYFKRLINMISKE